MQNFEIKPPFFGTLKWTPGNHVAPTILQQYVWDEAKGGWVFKPPSIWGDSVGNVKDFTEAP